jgi:hypothetical protein
MSLGLNDNDILAPEAHFIVASCQAAFASKDNDGIDQSLTYTRATRHHQKLFEKSASNRAPVTTRHRCLKKTHFAVHVA